MLQGLENIENMSLLHVKTFTKLAMAISALTNYIHAYFNCYNDCNLSLYMLRTVKGLVRTCLLTINGDTVICVVTYFCINDPTNCVCVCVHACVDVCACVYK